MPIAENGNSNRNSPTLPATARGQGPGAKGQGEMQPFRVQLSSGGETRTDVMPRQGAADQHADRHVVAVCASLPPRSSQLYRGRMRPARVRPAALRLRSTTRDPRCAAPRHAAPGSTRTLRPCRGRGRGRGRGSPSTAPRIATTVLIRGIVRLD